jgi:hypothetical protein
MKMIVATLIVLSALAGAAQAQPQFESGTTTKGQRPSPN